MRKILPTFLAVVLVLTVAFAYLLHSKNASAEVATHLVISEVQISGVGAGTSGNDFVEIYNPTDLAISLDGMRLGKKTSGTSSANVITFGDEDVVPAHGYLLWCNSSLSALMNCDSSGSGTLASDNSLALINGSLDAGAVVDAVTFGTPGTTYGEGISLTAPAGGTSVERKANSSSSEVSMGIGGTDEFLGNAEDTQDNSSDFVPRSIPQPQNSASGTEPITSPSPTTEPSVSPTEEPNPTQEPTAEPSPALTPVPTAEPTPTPTKGPKVVTKNAVMTCTLNFKPIKAFNFTYLFPIISCEKTSR